MRILYIHPAIRTYRIGIFELLSKKLNVDFFYSGVAKEGSYVDKEIKNILKITNIKYIQAKEYEKLPFDNFSFDLLRLPFMPYKIYIFSNITSVPYLILAPLLKVFGKKIIIFDELWRYPMEVRKYKIIYPYVRMLSKYFLDGVITAGSKSKEYYMNEFGITEDKINIAFNTTVDLSESIIDLKLNEKIKTKINDVTSKKKLLYLGRIVKYKGLDLLIESMTKVDAYYDLIVVGDGIFEKECRDLTYTLGLEKRIHFLGACESFESVYYYKNCDIFILPTRFELESNVQIESWGFTINEAMSMEMPIVTTNAVGSAYDLVIDEKTGGIAVANCADSLTDKINYTVKNNQNNIIGKNAKKHLLRTCNYEENYEAYSRMIKKIVNEK